MLFAFHDDDNILQGLDIITDVRNRACVRHCPLLSHVVESRTSCARPLVTEFVLVFVSVCYLLLLVLIEHPFLGFGVCRVGWSCAGATFFR